jgi:DNA-binding GntR family transcriptional regulator
MSSEAAEMHRVAPLQVKDLVYERLREALIDLTFAPGEPLREAALVERLGVSKTPIREALVRLERDGLVELAPYRGARARTYSQDDLRQMHEVREILETECVRRAAEMVDKDLVEALTLNVAASAAALDRGDLKVVAGYLDEFDRLLFGLLRNDMIADLVERLQAHLKRIALIDVAPDRLDALVEDHRAILSAITAHDPASAELLMRRHLVRTHPIGSVAHRPH